LPGLYIGAKAKETMNLDALQSPIVPNPLLSSCDFPLSAQRKQSLLGEPTRNMYKS